MTQQIFTEDALTRGELQFAIVQTFNANRGESDKDPGDNGSRDMTGTVRLMDGAVLPFAYVDGRFAIREEGNIHWDEEGYSPARGGYGMSWPHYGAVLMVEAEDGRVRRWTWPNLVLGNAYGIRDLRYLEPPNYGDILPHYDGLYCLVDLTLLDRGDGLDLLDDDGVDFPHPVSYIGHHADEFLDKTEKPYAFGVFDWDPVDTRVRLVSFEAKK